MNRVDPIAAAHPPGTQQVTALTPLPGPPPAPAEITAVRHAQSLAATPEIAEYTGRDADLPLSPTGETQAAALGHWLAGRNAPDVILHSPLRRARDTARIAARECAAAGRLLPRARRDERLRDRDMGVLELLTPTAVGRRYPGEAHRRARTGDFYYRPPGGESLADVALRLRSLLGELRHEATGRRILLVAHDAVVLMLRYLLEDLSEPDVLRLDRTEPVANASVSRWTFRDGLVVPGRYNDTRHL